MPRISVCLALMRSNLSFRRSPKKKKKCPPTEFGFEVSVQCPMLGPFECPVLAQTPHDLYTHEIIRYAWETDFLAIHELWLDFGSNVGCGHQGQPQAYQPTDADVCAL